MTFFSGTDLATLKSEGMDTNHFVSLIVNNVGTYCAAITRKVKTISNGTVSIEYKTFDNIHEEGETEAFEDESICIEYYPLEVIKENAVLSKSELELRLEEVRQKASSFVNRKYQSSVPIKSPSITSFESLTKESYNIPHNDNYKQLNLFSEEEMGAIKDDYKSSIELDPSVAYDEDHIDSKIVDNTVIQIITGDIFSIYKQNVDLNKWANNMEKLYSKRFNYPNYDCDGFRYWVDTFIEFLENELYDGELLKRGRDYMDAIWAYDVMVELEKYPKNKYLDTFIESLERWLI